MMPARWPARRHGGRFGRFGAWRMRAGRRLRVAAPRHPSRV